MVPGAAVSVLKYIPLLTSYSDRCDGFIHNHLGMWQPSNTCNKKQQANSDWFLHYPGLGEPNCPSQTMSFFTKQIWRENSVAQTSKNFMINGITQPPALWNSRPWRSSRSKLFPMRDEWRTISFSVWRSMLLGPVELSNSEVIPSVGKPQGM